MLLSGRNSEGIVLLYKNVLHDWVAQEPKCLQIFFVSKLANIMSRRRKISTPVDFIFHRVIQNILTPNYFKNLKKTS